MNSCMTDLYKGSTPNSSQPGTPSRGSQPSSRAGTPSRSLPGSNPPSGRSSPRRASSWCGKDSSHGDGRDLEKALFIIDRVGNLKQKGKVPVVESPLAADSRKTSMNSPSDRHVDLAETSLISPVNECVEMTLDVQRQEMKKDNLNDGSTRTDEHQLSVTDESMDAGTKMRQDKYTTPVTEVGSYTMY